MEYGNRDRKKVYCKRRFLGRCLRRATHCAGVYLFPAGAYRAGAHPGEKGFLTIKGASDEKGLSRYEFEQEIPLADAEQLLKLCEPGAIDKVRHLVRAGRHIWEVDVFHGANEGLVMAEIELASEEEVFEKPDWVGEEVSGDRRYYNSMLTKEPYTRWGK